jgi:hypothetical protein
MLQFSYLLLPMPPAAAAAGEPQPIPIRKCASLFSQLSLCMFVASLSWQNDGIIFSTAESPQNG